MRDVEKAIKVLDELKAALERVDRMVEDPGPEGTSLEGYLARTARRIRRRGNYGLNEVTRLENRALDKRLPGWRGAEREPVPIGCFGDVDAGVAAADGLEEGQ